MMATSRHMQSISITIVFHKAILHYSILELFVAELLCLFFEWLEFSRNKVRLLVFFTTIFSDISTCEGFTGANLMNVKIVSSKELKLFGFVRNVVFIICRIATPSIHLVGPVVNTNNDVLRAKANFFD